MRDSHLLKVTTSVNVTLGPRCSQQLLWNSLKISSVNVKGSTILHVSLVVF